MKDNKKAPEAKAVNPNMEHFKYEAAQELGLQNRRIKKNKNSKQNKSNNLM